MRYFFDNCMSPLHANGVREFAGLRKDQLVHLRDKFAVDTDDPVWIRALAREGDWVIVTGDLRISRNKLNKEAWHESRMTAFFFTDSWMESRDAEKFIGLVRWWERIEEQARETPTGHGFVIPRSGGKFECIYPDNARRRR